MLAATSQQTRPCQSRRLGARMCLPRAPPPTRSARLPHPPQARGIIAFVLDAIWAIFWLAAAGCASSVLNDADGLATSKLKASVA